MIQEEVSTSAKWSRSEKAKLSSTSGTTSPTEKYAELGESILRAIAAVQLDPGNANVSVGAFRKGGPEPLTGIQTISAACYAVVDSYKLYSGHVLFVRNLLSKNTEDPTKKRTSDSGYTKYHVPKEIRLRWARFLLNEYPLSFLYRWEGYEKYGLDEEFLSEHGWVFPNWGDKTYSYKLWHQAYTVIRREWGDRIILWDDLVTKCGVHPTVALWAIGLVGHVNPEWSVLSANFSHGHFPINSTCFTEEDLCRYVVGSWRKEHDAKPGTGNYYDNTKLWDGIPSSYGWGPGHWFYRSEDDWANYKVKSLDIHRSYRSDPRYHTGDGDWRKPPTRVAETLIYKGVASGDLEILRNMAGFGGKVTDESFVKSQFHVHTQMNRIDAYTRESFEKWVKKVSDNVLHQLTQRTFTDV